jgi:hypothetical protein
MEKLLELEKNFNEMREDVSDIKIALLGNEFNNNQGFVHRVITSEAEIKLLKEYVQNEKIRSEAREAREKRMMRFAGFVLTLISILSIVWALKSKIKP